MLRARRVEAVDDFLLGDDDQGFRSTLERSWSDGSSHPSWCVVLERDGKAVGRVGFRLEPSTSDPAWQGTLRPSELHAFGLWWTDGPAVGQRLLMEGLSRVVGLGPEHIQVRVNSRLRGRHREQVAVLASIGRLFQEKVGFELDPAAIGSATMPQRLRWVDVNEVGRDRYAEIMGRCGEQTLDRNDAWYWGHCGPDNWGRQMMEYLTAATATLARRGITAMLSDVDVHNRPMLDAMARAGHRQADWRVWHFRCPVPVAN